jgi:hypothetical protein
MELKTAFIHRNRDGGLIAKAAIDVPGLGEVNIEHALSEEVCMRIRDEAIAALRLKLGQMLVTNDVQ